MTTDIETPNGDVPINGQNGVNGHSNGDTENVENGYSNGNGETETNGANGIPKKRIVIVGLGMVAVGFM